MSPAYQPAGSGTLASVTTTEALMLLETFPAASLAQAYKVFVPAVANVYELGAAADQPAAVADGAAADSLTRYPVTATSSVAVRVVIPTVNVDAVTGTVNAVTVGGVVSFVVAVKTRSTQKFELWLPFLGNVLVEPYAYTPLAPETPLASACSGAASTPPFAK
jgi:hypothetical protein